MKYIFSMFSTTYSFTSLLSYHLFYVLVTVLYMHVFLKNSISGYQLGYIVNTFKVLFSSVIHKAHFFLSCAKVELHFPILEFQYNLTFANNGCFKIGDNIICESNFI